MRFKLFTVIGFITALVFSSVLRAEAVREREREREKETIEKRIQGGNKGKATLEAIEKEAAEKAAQKTILEQYKGSGADGASTGSGAGGLKSRTVPKENTGKSGAASHEGVSENDGYTPGKRVKGAAELESVGKGGREEATGKELKGEEKKAVAEAVKKEDEAIAATVDGTKIQKEKIKALKELEANTRLFTKDASGKLVEAYSKDKEANDAILRLTQFVEAPARGEVELALRVMAKKMFEQGKSFAEVEATIKDFMEFWKKEVEGKLPKDLQKDALANMLAMFHRNPKSLAGMKAKIQELIKSESDPEVVLKGLVLSAKAYGEPFLKGIREGLSIADAHANAVKEKIAFLKERNLTDKEISELPQCMNPALGLAAELLRSGH